MNRSKDYKRMIEYIVARFGVQKIEGYVNTFEVKFMAKALGETEINIASDCVRLARKEKR
jgi:hypothetical protein